jgi:hypothetical protein
MALKVALKWKSLNFEQKTIFVLHTYYIFPLYILLKRIKFSLYFSLVNTVKESITQSSYNMNFWRYVESDFTARTFVSLRYLRSRRNPTVLQIFYPNLTSSEFSAVE